MLTLPMPGSDVAGSSGSLRCRIDHLPANATEYAALWAPVVPPNPPSAPPAADADKPFMPVLLPIDANPVFHTVSVILILHLISLAAAEYLRRKRPLGILGRRRELSADLTVHPTVAALEQSSQEGAASEPLAIMGPSEAEVPSLPKLSIRFEIEADMATFDEGAFLRRLATLVGVEDMLQAVVSAGSSASSIAIDTEIECPDATTLVMAAKTLKKAIKPLGMALGVQLVDTPGVTIPEPQAVPPVAAAERPVPSMMPTSPGDAQKAQGPTQAADQLIPTIQERIPAPTRGNVRRLGLNDKPAPAAGATGRLDLLGVVPTREGLPAESAMATPPPPPLEGGIQERISMSGMSRPTRGATALRLRANAASGVAALKGNSMAQLGGAAQVGANLGLSSAARGQAGLLGALGLSDAPGADASTAQAPQKEGIQERLPAMPGMRRQTGRRATGEPRLRAPGTVADALRSAPPPEAMDTTDTATPDEPQVSDQPIQERVPRVTRPPAPPTPADYPPATPPPSPPGVLASPSKMNKAVSDDSPFKAGKVIVKSEAAVAGAAYETRLQNHPRVLPKGGAEEEEKSALPETWDDRSAPQILWGIAREHTFVGFVAAFLFGSGPKLASLPQAVQLFFATLTGLLFLSCVEIHFSWLGATWVLDSPAYDQGVGDDVMARLPFLSAVSAGAALVSWPCMIAGRWFFMLADVDKGTPIYGAVWLLSIIYCGSCYIGAIALTGEMDATVVRADVFVAWLLAVMVQWLLFEPAGLLAYALLTLLLKWCTSFEDLPEVKAEKVRKEKKNAQDIKDAKQEQRQASNEPQRLQLVAPKGM